MSVRASTEGRSEPRRTQTSAVERLLSLPDAFSLNACATLLGIEKRVAKVYLSRWSAAGYIKASGPRTGFYFNVLKNRSAPSELLAEAMRHVYPTAMVRGVTVLHAAGKTAQGPQLIEVAVLAPLNRARTDGFDARAKPRRWYAAVQEMKEQQGLFGLPSLQPEMALADLYATPNDWHPDIDDLEVDELDWVKFKSACEILRVDVPQQLMHLVERASETSTVRPIGNGRAQGARS